MENLRITNGFERMSDATLLARTNQILSDLVVNFATAPGLTVLTSAKDVFETALAQAQDGGTYEKALKNQSRDELITQLHLMGNYVMYMSGGDRAMALSSGFSIAKSPSPAPEVTKAENQKLEDGLNAGELRLTFDRVPGARSYVYQTSPDPLTGGSTWNSDMGTVRKYKFSGLESGRRYWCRVAAVGIAGQTVYSDPMSRLVQ